jgi:hypothetical protein
LGLDLEGTKGSGVLGVVAHVLEGMMNMNWEFRGCVLGDSYLRRGALTIDSMAYFLPFARRFISFTILFLLYKGVIF